MDGPSQPILVLINLWELLCKNLVNQTLESTQNECVHQKVIQNGVLACNGNFQYNQCQYVHDSNVL